MKWHWQYLIPLILTVSNVDWILMPIIRLAGINGWRLFIVISVLEIFELLLWYWFWEWFRKVAVLIEFKQYAKNDKRIQDAIKLGEEIQAELKKTGILDKTKDKVMSFFFNTLCKYTDENNRFIKRVKRGRNIAMLLLGLDPYPGGRTFGIIFCGSAGWKNGLYPLAIGNTLRVAYTIGIFNYIISIFKK